MVDPRASEAHQEGGGRVKSIVFGGCAAYKAMRARAVSRLAAPRADSRQTPASSTHDSTCPLRPLRLIDSTASSPRLRLSRARSAPTCRRSPS
eukprot:scaffold222302_cov35-Tisochrysis_lutea.AAC.1